MLRLVDRDPKGPWCGLCGRHNDEADLMLGPKPFICDRCVVTCIDVMILKQPIAAASLRQIKARIDECICIDQVVR